MATIRVTEGDLRAAMRDPRYWQSGHPERGAYAGWVTEGWQRLHGAEATTEGGTRVVQVQAYDRVRNGRREHVDPYQQRRRAARGEGGGTAGEAPGRVAPEPAPGPTAAPRRPSLVVFVGGLYDGAYRPVLDVFDREKRNTPPNTQMEYVSHDAPSRIRALIEGASPGTRIVVVGHSWGADTAAEVVGRLGQQGRPIDMLVTIDPVGNGLSRDFMQRVRAGSREWINVNAVGGSPTETSNIIAGVGGEYGRLPQGFASQHFDAPYTHAQFGRMMELRLPSSTGTLLNRAMGR